MRVLRELYKRAYNYKRDVEERHPLTLDTTLSPEGQLEQLRNLTSLLWDQVWWMQLPFYRRWFYKWQGFRAPIPKFYEEIESGDKDLLST
jgi:hypothetical protein